MKWMMIFSLVLIVIKSNAQSPDTTPPYRKNPGFPAVELIQPDSTTISKDYFQKHWPVIIMYFSPTCDHCIHQTEDILKKIDDLKNYHIILATYEPFDQMAAFAKKYKLANYSNIKIGRDTRFTLPPYFRMKGLPYFALYDKEGKLIATFDESNISINKLIRPFTSKK